MRKGVAKQICEFRSRTKLLDHFLRGELYQRPVDVIGAYRAQQAIEERPANDGRNSKDVTESIVEPVDPCHQHPLNSWRIAVGGIYQLAVNTDLRAGVAFDQTPISSQFVNALLPQTDAIVVGLGIRQRINEAKLLLNR